MPNNLTYNRSDQNPLNPAKTLCPGCLCILLTSPLRPDLTGTQCHLLRNLREGEIVEYAGGPHCVDRTDMWSVEIPGQDHLFVAITRQLIRIDGYAPDSVDLSDVIHHLRHSQRPKPNPGA